MTTQPAYNTGGYRFLQKKGGKGITCLRCKKSIKRVSDAWCPFTGRVATIDCLQHEHSLFCIPCANELAVDGTPLHIRPQWIRWVGARVEKIR